MLFEVFKRNSLDLRRILRDDILRLFAQQHAFALCDAWCAKKEALHAVRRLFVWLCAEAHVHMLQFLRRRELVDPRDRAPPPAVATVKEGPVEPPAQSSHTTEEHFAGIFGAGFRTALHKLPSFKASRLWTAASFARHKLRVGLQRKPVGPVTPPPPPEEQQEKERGREPRSPSASPPSSPRTRSTSPSLSGLDELDSDAEDAPSSATSSSSTTPSSDAEDAEDALEAEPQPAKLPAQPPK